MTRVNRLYQRLKRGIAFLLALILTVQPFFSFDMGLFPALAAETEGRGSTFAYYNSSNLLKPGANFPFYGKNHNRVGLWPYGITNVEGGRSAPGYCLEPNKSMQSGTGGTIVTYDLDQDGDNLPLGITREEAEILWYALSSSGNFEGYQTGVGKVGQGHYILGQAATWAIMSGNWNGLEDFRQQMEVLMDNLKSPQLAAQTRGALEQFFNQTNGAVEETAVPPFASKFKSTAPAHQMQQEGDGTYRITLDYGDGFDWRQSELVYDLPEGWNMVRETSGVTFICTTGNPDIGLVKGYFPEGSAAAKYWIKPNTFKVWYPDGWTESSAVEGKQAMITMAGAQEPWEVWLSFGKGTTTEKHGDYEIPYSQYLHEETFKRDYKIELEKQCDETGKMLEGSTFEILEQFDFSQLDGTNLEEEQFRKNLPTSEGDFENLSVCQSGITTDINGHLEHSDHKTYEYEKTYCGGHPEPIIHYVEVDDDASDEERDAADEENERLEREAWEAWQECVDWCEEHCDFHSIDEGVARDEMEEDRNEAWESFIHLKRIYTVREVQARTGYILHDLHEDDERVEIVEFSSSQTEGDGAVTGYYDGNRMKKTAEQAAEELEAIEPEAAVSARVTNLVQAKAMLSDGEDGEAAENKEGIGETEETVPESSETGEEPETSEDEKESETSETDTEDTDGGETETIQEADSVQIASKSEAEEIEEDIEPATPSNASIYSLRIPSIRLEDDGGAGGHWEWDGVQEESEVAHINQSNYPADYTGFSYLVKDHRTEGELHINKRDLELFEKEGEDSYGKSQADATLEGAVYGLYAAEDIIHPDGKTGVVFSSGELIAIAATDKNGDASFLVITEETETSKSVPNLYEDNADRNGNGWIGRPLILGSYYVEEISRSEGYELSRTGKNHSESNRTGIPVVLTESGSAHTGGFFHEINEWDGKSYDFTVDYFKTKGFDVVLSGLPEDSRVYEVTRTEETTNQKVVTGTARVEKKDADGNPVYQTAEGGEYKLDADGNRIVKLDADGNPVDSDQPSSQTVTAVNRLNVYIPAIEREESFDMDLEESEEIDEDYILWETSSALAMSGYKNSLSDAPWNLLKLSGNTNGEIIDEILTACSSDSFWDAYDVEQIFEKDGSWYAKIRYAYKALKNQPVIYERGSGRLAIRKEYEGGYYYAIYEEGEYKKDGYRFTVEKKELDLEAFSLGEIRLKTVYAPVYERYEAGELLLDNEGNPIPQMETVPVYTNEAVTEYQETLTSVTVNVDRDSGRLIFSVDTNGEAFDKDKAETRTYRVVTGQDITQYREAAVSAITKKPEMEDGSYIKYTVLLYPGQYEIYEDDGTREKPLIVLERVIKQAIKVTKDIALDSYEHNTYEIHRDPFTVLFGGYNGKLETKTLPGFFFKLYLRSDLEKTGNLSRKEDGTYDYTAFFQENPEYAESLALEWDIEKYDADGDMTTVHANRGGGTDDYWGQSRMMPYGVYVLVEQQPEGIPQKHYAIDSPKEVEIPFVPQIEEDGTVHDKLPDPEYLYDSHMTPETLMERYYIRFNEETHIIYAHNNDGDFEVFKYGLEPDSRRDCHNDLVAAYYHYGSISEDAGIMDGVYYETYYDRDGQITDYGVTMDGVDTMTGISTAVDRKYAKALVPWSVLDPRYGEIINDNGDIGNRDSGLEDGSFNFVAFANKDFENEFYSSRLRIEKLDAETGENILHDGALFKIYAAKRDIAGDGAAGVTGSGDILFDENGIPLYDESEQIFMRDDTGAEVGIFKAYTTVRDGEVTKEDGSTQTEKQCVGYLETYQPLGAGAYVLVEVEAPEGYVKSKPIAFTVYSDKVEYYEEGDAGKKVQAVKYQYMRPVGSDGKTVTEDMHQMVVKDQPTRIEIHKVENPENELTYRVYGDEKQLKARGDVTLQYKPNGEFAGFGYVTKTLKPGDGDPLYVENATLTLYEGLEVKQTGEHEYEGVEVKRNLFDSVIGIIAHNTGVDTDIRVTGTDSTGKQEWDITQEAKPPMDLWYYDLEYDPTELDTETGILYGLDDWGNRVCMLDSETGMAYVTDEHGTVIVWPLDDNGDKIISQSVEVYTDEHGNQTINTDLSPVTDENGLPIYYKDGGVTWIENEWVTEEKPYEIARVRQGAYILEETAAPLADGYVQSIAIGLIVRDTGEVQPFYMEDDYTKLEVSKLDMTSREEIEGASLALYEAYRVYDDSDRGWHLEILRDMDGSPIVAESWVSGGGKPHWIHHIMPGDYILQEIRVPTEAGYVTASEAEVIIKETGEVQGVVMEDDHTAVEFLKVDGKTGKPMANSSRATLALYHAVLNDEGEPLYDENGIVRYDKNQKVYQWQTDDGSEVRKTAHQVPVPGGHSYTAYDYEIKPVPGTVQAICYVTEKGTMRFEYLPVGKYVLVEEQAPDGYTVADPVYVPVLDVGSKERIQGFTMVDEPIQVLLSKVNTAGGKELAGATVAVYRAASDGSLVKYQMTDEDGNLLYVTNLDGNLLKDEAGNLIPAMAYDENYLVERWISGYDGRYTKKDEADGKIPEGFAAGDLKPHTLNNPLAGSYYFVEEQTPFGYVRAVELPFEITDSRGIQRFELVDELIMGQLELIKSDAGQPDRKLAGARFKFTNLDTNSATILITDEDGKAVSSPVPIGSVGADGSVSLYHFSVQEVKAPDGYLLDPEAETFQFNVRTDRNPKIVFTYEAFNQPTEVIVSKKKLTNKEELPGASLEVRPVTVTTGEDGEIVRTEGEVLESWISTDTPHKMKGLKPGEYVLIEIRAPEGYLEAEKVYFTVQGNMTVGDTVFVEMFDDDTKTEIIKVDKETREPVAGATLQLVKADSMELVREWITDETGSIQIQGLPAGEYLVREVKAPDGYLILKEPLKITVVKDYKIQTFVVENQKIQTVIEKTDTETGEPVAGAVLRLIDETGNEVARWVTTKEAQVLPGLKPGWYTVEEVQAPGGYLLLKEPLKIQITNEEERQVFTVRNQKLEMDILKTDQETGEALAGAMLRLIRNSDQSVIDEWKSTGVAKIIKGLLPGSYTLEEVSAPDGYAVGKPVVFEVTGEEDTLHITLGNQKIQADFEKKDSLSQKPVSGAVLQLIRNAGTGQEVIVKEWISDESIFTLTGIEAGLYIVREITAPPGYAPMEDMEIEILPDQPQQTFTILNQPIQVEIEKTSGDTGKLLGGAVLQLVRNKDGAVIREWTSKEGEAEHFTGLQKGAYTIREVKAPSGYKKMEPQEIQILEKDELQEFVVKNYKIDHSGGGGGDTPKPKGEYMELYKTDALTGEKLAGAKITVYRPDGSVYFEGITDKAGKIRFKVPENGNYTFKEVSAPEGYYLNPEVYQFTVKGGTIEGDTVIPDYKKGTVVISKVDVTTAEELPGAQIEITDKDGNRIYSGVSDEHGKVYFEVPAPGEYRFREVAAPEGYELNETIFSFTVFEDGSIIGDCTITNQKHYGTITASYETDRKGDGDLTVGTLRHAPKTGDESHLFELFLMWLLSVGGILLFGFRYWMRRKKRNDGLPPIRPTRKRGMKISAFFLTVCLAAGFPAMEVKAAADVLENIYEEHQYKTENPDSDEAEGLFEKELKRDGITYRLSEIRTEVIEENPAETVGDTITITTAPFLEEKTESYQPEGAIEREGIFYQLKDSILEKADIPAHEVPITEEVVYEAVEGKDMIPSRIPVSVTDDATGQQMEGIADISGQEFGEERWEENFSFPVTFHEYGLEGYWLGETVFKLDDDTPDFHGYEAELLALIGVSNEEYTVETVTWDGEAYEDSEGILCRNAVASGKKLVSDCKAVYQGTAVFREESGVRYRLTYLKKEAESSGKTVYTMKATGVYVPKKNHAAAVAAVIGLGSAGAGTAGYAVYRKRKQSNMA